MRAARRGMAAWLAACLAACGSSVRSSVALNAAPSPCAPLATPAASPESLTVVVSSPVGSPNAMSPRTAAARFVTAQMYETLVHVDCDGRLVPGLASSWTANASGGWTLRLRPGASFWNGDAVTVQDIVTAWQTTANSALDRTSAAIARAMAGAVSIVDDHTMAIADSALRTLADPALAVRRPAVGSPWPEGTGRYRAATTPADPAGSLELVPAPLSSGAAPRIVVRSGSDLDARDRLDAGADLLFTNDPAVLSYAAARADLASVPLTWDRTYALLVPWSSSQSRGTTADTIRAALARDAVRVEARAAAPPYWWNEIAACPAGFAPNTHAAPTAPSAHVVYRANDRVARGLAERLVALAAMRRANDAGAPLADLAPELASAPRLTAEGLAPAAFAAALAAGGALAYVVDLPAQPLARCGQADALAAAAPWLAPDSGIVPLVDTRRHVVVRRDRVSFVIDWEGVLRIGTRQPR